MTWHDLKNDERYEMRISWGCAGRWVRVLGGNCEPGIMLKYYGPDKVRMLQETRENFT